MKELEKSSRSDGLLYILIKRNGNVALFGIGGGTSTDKIRHWEVCKIQIRNDQYRLRGSI